MTTNTLPWLAAEGGTYSSSTSRVVLTGVAANFGIYPTRTFAQVVADTDVAFASGDDVFVVVAVDGNNWSMYSGATWNDAASDYIDLGSATSRSSEGTVADGATVTVYAVVPFDRLLSADERAALDAATTPDADNAIATMDDLDGVSSPPRSTVAIAAGAAAFELDGSAYTCQLTEDLATPTVPLPSGGDASTFEYGCRADFTAPDAGGPFAVSIPTAWLQLGPLDAISLSAGDEAIVMILSTYVDGTIGYTAAQGVPGA